MPETDFSIRTFKGGFDNNLSSWSHVEPETN